MTGMRFLGMATLAAALLADGRSGYADEAGDQVAADQAKAAVVDAANMDDQLDEWNRDLRQRQIAAHMAREALEARKLELIRDEPRIGAMAREIEALERQLAARRQAIDEAQAQDERVAELSETLMEREQAVKELRDRILNFFRDRKADPADDEDGRS